MFSVKDIFGGTPLREATAHLLHTGQLPFMTAQYPGTGVTIPGTWEFHHVRLQAGEKLVSVNGYPVIASSTTTTTTVTQRRKRRRSGSGAN